MLNPSSNVFTPFDIGEEIKKYGEIIELGLAVSLSAPELNAAKEDKMTKVGLGWSYADFPNHITYSRFE